MSGAARREPHPLDAVLRPRGVVVVGASGDPTKRGHQVVRALVESSYPGGVFPVNPRGGELFGLPVAPSVEAVDAKADLALICTPAESVAAVVEGCVRAGIRGAVILAVGFGERGEAGRALETRVLEAARRGGIRVVGPNTSGLLNLGLDLNLIGITGLRRGNLALLVQSGNTALSLLTRAAERGGGVSVCVGVGNEADIRFDEYLDWLEGDDDTRAILMYVDGFRDGRRFLETARRVTRTKPIVLLKGGRSEVGRAAARSHTGALAGEYATLRAALRQAGVLEAARSDELLAMGETLAGQPPVAAGTPRAAGPGVGGVAVLADGGGQAVIAADALSHAGVPLARLRPETEGRLRELLGPAAEVANPVDVAGAGDRRPAVFARALEELAGDPAVGGVLMIGLFGGYALRFAASLEAEETEAAAGLVAAAGAAGKPLVVHSIYAESGSAPIGVLREAGVPVIESVEVACAAIGAASRRGRLLAECDDVPAVRPPAPTPRIAAGARPAADALEPARREGRTTLLETETRELLARYGVPLVAAELCDSADAVRAAAARVGGAVVLKVVSPAVAHKTEAGGVALDVPDPDAAVAAWERMRREVARHAATGEAGIRGVLVAPMLPRPLAELLIGMRRDPSFGPVLTFGAGGVLTELLRDTALRVLPIHRDEALAMLDETRVAGLLRGFRGGAAADREALADVLLAVARCALENEAIAELEINPLFAYADRLVAVDARAYLVGG